MPGVTRREALKLIEANTEVRSPPLCPEIRLRLLREDAPLRHATQKRLFADDGPRPYWAFCWGGGQALARYLLDHPHLVQGRRVLDFGAGSGVAAIAAVRAGAAQVTATDVDPVALTAVELNARLNQVTVAARTENTLEADNGDWDVLLAGDVCYLTANYQWLSALAQHGKRVLLGDPGRPDLELDKLDELARFAVRTTPELEHPDLTEAAVYRFRPPPRRQVSAPRAARRVAEGP